MRHARFFGAEHKRDLRLSKCREKVTVRNFFEGCQSLPHAQSRHQLGGHIRVSSENVFRAKYFGLRNSRGSNRENVNARMPATNPIWRYLKFLKKLPIDFWSER